MKVQVFIEISDSPTEDYIDDLKSAAEELTDDPESIHISTHKKDEGYELITEFSMIKAAQYKAVDEVSKMFRYYVEDYEDMSIKFD